MRQGADAIDERRDFDIVRGLMAKEPAPELIVLTIQQLSENPAFGFGNCCVFAVQPALQQLIEFAHAAPATPAQAFDIRFLRRAHPCSRPTASKPHNTQSSTLLARNA